MKVWIEFERKCIQRKSQLFYLKNFNFNLKILLLNSETKIFAYILYSIEQCCFIFWMKIEKTSNCGKIN